MKYDIKLMFKDNTEITLKQFDVQELVDRMLFNELKKYSIEMYKRNDLRAFQLIKEYKDD